MAEHSIKTLFLWNFPKLKCLKGLKAVTWCNKFLCVSITPFGLPVVPLVYIRVAISSEPMASYL